MTIMKTVIGVGVLGLPKVMQNLGWVIGLLIFACTSYLNQYSCIILLKVKNLSHHSNYSTIGYYIFKSKWFQAYTYFLILFNNFGVCKINLMQVWPSLPSSRKPLKESLCRSGPIWNIIGISSHGL